MLGSGQNGEEKIAEALFIPIGVLEDWISDIGTNNAGDGFGSTVFSADGGLTSIILIVRLDFSFISCVNVWLLE